jgi:hypothetical protein
VDQAAFQRWWEMHLRLARGHVLNAEERALYEAGRQELERDERLQELQTTKQARERLQALEAERSQLERRRLQLESEIAALEKKLDEGTRQLLGVEE